MRKDPAAALDEFIDDKQGDKAEICGAEKENPAAARGVGGEPGSLSNTTIIGVGERESGGYDQILADSLWTVKVANGNDKNGA